jgi:hypothetical protein
MTDPEAVTPIVAASGPQRERPWAEAVARRREAAK